MLFRWLLGNGNNPKSAPAASDELRALVSRSMPEADLATASIVGAVAGLCAIVAHADRAYTDAERALVRAALGRVHGLSPGAVDAVCALLEVRLSELAFESLQTYTAVLNEHAERAARLEVLDVLMDLAAADDLLDMQETNVLRRIARSLGLDDREYLASQSRHRERLSVLKKA